MQAKRAFFPFLLAMIVMVLTPGCGDDQSPTNTQITAPEAQAAGEVLAGQAAELVDHFTLTSLGDLPFQKAVEIVPASSPFRRSLAWQRLLRYAIDADSCASFTDTTDTDGDGVPDDLIVRFDQPGCTESGDSVTAQLSGSFRITDPGTTPGFDIAYSNVRLHFQEVNGNYLDLRLNGTQGVTATETVASLHENVSYVFGARQGAQTLDMQVSQNWNAGFEAAEGQSIVVDSPLPDGALTLSGSSVWGSGSHNFAFTMSTQSPLEHLASCTLTPTFESGELRALVTGNQGGAFIRVLFIGCGVDPIIALIGQPAQ
jgi:hypothetical protein